jgi:hypothetical protein
MTEQDPTRPPDESPGGDEGELKDSYLDPNEEEKDGDLKASYIDDDDPPLHAHGDEPGGG